MRGSIKKRYEGSWSLILDFAYRVDPKTGQRRRHQKWITFRGTKRKAQERLAELVTERSHGTFVSPSKLTFGDWLDTWVDKAIKPPRRTLRAYETYQSVITKHVKPKLGAIRLQELLPTDLERYYAELGQAPATLENCWEAHEARQFLETAKAAGPQPAAFYALALETGMRKSELCGLKWSDLDVQAQRLNVQRQLVQTWLRTDFRSGQE
jgi:integrase